MEGVIGIVNKSRKQKQDEYNQKYANIPRDQEARLNYMCELYKVTPQKMAEIIDKRNNMLMYLQYYDFLIILYEDPEGAKRPRYRLISPKNYMIMAAHDPINIHVYSPNAAQDSKFMHRLVEQELLNLQWFIQTPMIVEINSFFKTPNSFSITDKFIAEMGLHTVIVTPDWDNIGKKYCDMQNGNTWLDDSLVTRGTVGKYYSILPRVEIKIKYLNAATCQYQYNNITSRKGYNPEYPIEVLDKSGRL